MPKWALAPTNLHMHTILLDTVSIATPGRRGKQQPRNRNEVIICDHHRGAPYGTKRPRVHAIIHMNIIIHMRHKYNNHVIYNYETENHLLRHCCFHLATPSYSLAWTWLRRYLPLQSYVTLGFDEQTKLETLIFTDVEALASAARILYDFFFDSMLLFLFFSVLPHSPLGNISCSWCNA